MSGGSVRRLASGRYQVRVSAGFGQDGRRRVLTVTCKTARDADRVRAELVAGGAADRRARGCVAVPRVPFEPLRAWATARSTGDVMSLIADRGGVSRSTVHRWAHRGVPIWAADRLAARGFHEHPCSIWPDWFEMA